MDAAEYLTSRIRQIRRDFLRADVGESSDPPRWRICATQVRQELPQVLGALYVKNHLSMESKLSVGNFILQFYVRKKGEKHVCWKMNQEPFDLRNV